MKILQIHNKVPYPPKDGGAIGILNFTLEMARQGHEVSLFAINTNKHYCDISQIPAEIKEKFQLISVDLDTSISFVSAIRNFLFSKHPYNAERFIAKKVQSELIALLEKEKFDVIQLEGLYVTPYLQTVRAHSTALISFKSHNIEHEIWQRVAHQETFFLKKKYLNNLVRRIKKMEDKALQLSDVNVTVTQRDAEYVKSAAVQKPCHVAPAGINTLHLTPDLSTTDFSSIFFIGALDWTPNQEGLLWFLNEVWTDFSKEISQIKLHIAGRNAPQWLIQRISTFQHIQFHGEIDDAYTYMNQGGVMIVPLLSGSGMRVKIIEGMAMQKTIISTEIGVEGIQATHGINILVANTKQEFIISLKKIISDSAFNKQIGNNAREFAITHFSIEQITAKLITFWMDEIAKPS